MKFYNSAERRVKAEKRKQKRTPVDLVRRHMKWNRFRFELFDILAHRFFHFKRRLCDAASVAVQSSVV